MDLRLFEVFCRVYRERSSRAARELSLTQPTISAHIKELEDQLGTPLFNRLGREIQPTEAGRFLYEHAKSLLSLKRTLVEKMVIRRTYHSVVNRRRVLAPVTDGFREYLRGASVKSGDGPRRRPITSKSQGKTPRS